MSRPLRLYWWADKPNFGDRISAEIVARVSGREIEWAAPQASDLFAVGSILIFARRAFAAPRPGRKPVVWGSGTARPIRVDFVPNVEFAAVRGPLTATLLELPAMPYGDPGILIADVVGPPAERHDRIGLVLHHSQGLDAAARARLDRDGRFEVIDPSAEDHLDTVRRIAACRHVVSSSLHGLIVADAYGVPNTWLDPAGIHSSARLKFYDYALGIGRLMAEPVEIGAIFDLADALPRGRPRLPYAGSLDSARAGLIDAFPAALAEPETVAG